VVLEHFQLEVVGQVEALMHHGAEGGGVHVWITQVLSRAAL
jgi:hypothetical protein